MQHPVPDGYLGLKHCVPGLPDKIFFRNLRGWDKREEALYIWWDNDRRTMSVIPFYHLYEIEMVPNSDAYFHLLTRFQRQHDHNWVEDEPPPMPTFVIPGIGKFPPEPDEDVLQEKVEHCCTDKIGNEGCEVVRVNGVISYADGSFG